MIAGAALCALCSFASAQAKKDEMCDVIDSFADGIAVDEKRSMELETQWGGNAVGETHSMEVATQNSDTIVLASKSCKPSAMDEKGRVICQWMMKNTSMEFMGHNISRVIACVTKGPKLIRKDVHVDSLSGELTVYGRQADINVKYQFNSRYDKRNFVAIRITGAEPEE
ncbi:hypothetical protein CR152_08300 [Massilia violaceinigra]|uniref:Uncharacterized protein n=2 Tax=Massilia violaceinigra TaxID=2045208 RepID=A0A2D2DHR6_9BURK|nr:hypothetical protein CR152_08300 [Massilia violaceinigra]